MIERLNEVNLRIAQIVEESEYSSQELLDLVFEREEIKQQLDKEELNGRD